MNTANRVIKNTGFLYAKMGITVFISLYTTRLILNSLGASDFGVFNVVGGAIAMLGFLNAAMASATQRFMSYSEGEGNKEKQKKIFNISIVLHFGIALVVGLVLLMAGAFFFHGILNIAHDRIFAAKVVYGSLIVSTMFTVMTVPYDAVLNAHENMLYYAIVGIIESLLKLAVAFAVIYTSLDKLILYGVLMVCIPFITMTIMRVYCHKRYEECTFAPKRYWERSLAKEMTSFAGWNLLGASSSMISNYGRSIVANNFFGTVVNAALGIVAQLNGQLLAFSNNMMKAITPIIVKAEGSGERKNMLEISFTACRLSFLIYAAFAIPLFTDSSFILKLWLKNVPQYTEIFFKIFIFQVLIEQISLPLGTILSAIGKIKGYNIWNTIIMSSSLVIMFFLFKIGFRPYTLMVVSLCSAALLMLIKIVYSKLCSNMSILSYLMEIIVPCFIATFIDLIALHFIEINFHESPMRLVLIWAISTLLLGVLSYLFVLSEKEKRVFVQLIIKEF